MRIRYQADSSPRALLIVKRWISIFILSVLTGVIMNLGARLLYEGYSVVKVMLFIEGSTDIFAYIVVFGIIIAIMKYVFSTRACHIWIISYPPLVLSLLISPFTFYLLFSCIYKNPFNIIDSLLLSWIFFQIWVLYCIVDDCWNNTFEITSDGANGYDDPTNITTIKPKYSELPRIWELSSSDFIKWCNDDGPGSLKGDLLKFTDIAILVYNKLKEGKSISLVGEYGVGKSTIINIVYDMLSPESSRYHLIKISCWGIKDASKAHEFILEETIKYLHKK